MKCMIVEDELPAVRILENYIGQFSELEIVSIHNNGIDAMTALQRSPCDILFLDIQLPKISGIQLLHTLKHYPAVILTTAHREFALEGYELEITDYLLKPIAFDRFAKAIAKINKHIVNTNPTTQAFDSSTLYSEPFIYVKNEREFVKIVLKNILYIESIKNHVKIVTNTENVLTLMSLTHIQEKLPEKHFIRVHRSYIVSVEQITRFSHDNVMIQQVPIPIGRHYKNSFQTWINQNTL